MLIVVYGETVRYQNSMIGVLGPKNFSPGFYTEFSHQDDDAKMKYILRIELLYHRMFYDVEYLHLELTEFCLSIICE